MHAGRLVASLRKFRENEIDFILVGGVAAVLNGAPIQTLDIDLVYSLDSENLDRLLFVLEEIDAIFRVQPGRRLRPNRSHLAGGGHLNLLTHYGPIDLLGFIGQNLRYRDLIPHSTEMIIAEGISIRVLNLEMLIDVKQQLASEKDLAVLHILRQTLKQKDETKES